MRLYLPTPELDKIPSLLSSVHLRRYSRDAILIARILLRMDPVRIEYSGQRAIQMWENYLPTLVRLHRQTNEELRRRSLNGYVAAMPGSMLEEIQRMPDNRPVWMDLQRMFDSHRAMLLHMQSNWYSRHDWLDAPAPIAVWPDLIPQVGSTMSCDQGQFWVVSERRWDGLTCVQSDQRTVDVPAMDIYTRRWRRVVVE